jgi:hypothetical protein
VCYQNGAPNEIFDGVGLSAAGKALALPLFLLHRINGAGNNYCILEYLHLTDFRVAQTADSATGDRPHHPYFIVCWVIFTNPTQLVYFGTSPSLNLIHATMTLYWRPRAPF